MDHACDLQPDREVDLDENNLNHRSDNQGVAMIPQGYSIHESNFTE